MTTEAKDILIVTCARDSWQFKLQCQSIGKYLEPVHVHVVINEKDCTVWRNWFDTNCREFLVAHRLTVVNALQLVDQLQLAGTWFTRPALVNASPKSMVVYDFDRTAGINGWITQQIFKLVYALTLDRPYWVFDSKNWFVKPMLMKDLVKYKRHDQCDPVFYKFLAACKMRFNQPGLNYRPVITPYYFDSQVVKKMFDHWGGVRQFVSWFMQFQHPSEFMVYDIFAQAQVLDTDTGGDVKYQHNYWTMHGAFDPNNFEQQLQNPQIKLLSIQLGLLPLVNTDKIEQLLGNTRIAEAKMISVRE